jgi:hypothetical protein
VDPISSAYQGWRPASMTLASTAKPSPLTKPALIRARTAVSNTWRNRSLAVPIDRECRVVRYGVVQIEAAQPAVSEMQLDLLAQSPLEADAVAVAHDQHAKS